MAPLPKLPPPPPQLDFPAMEQVRRDLVSGYRAMVQDMVAALTEKMDSFAQEAAVKSEPVSYQQGAQKPQASRRAQIVSVLIRLGAQKADFEPGGSYFHSSDNDLYAIAQKGVAAYKRRKQAAL